MRAHRHRVRAAALIAGVVLLGQAADGHADDKQTCIGASDAAQQLRIDGKLAEARAQLLVCARTQCPVLVRQDCSQWLTEVVAAQPSVVLGARDAQGHDLFDVRVSVDGIPIAQRLDGKAIVVDPGRHTFRYELGTAAGPAPVVLEVLVREGEKNREITAAFPAASAAAVTSVAPQPAAPEPLPHASRSGASPLVWLFGGVAAAALGTSLAFVIAQDVEYNHLAAACGGHCTPDQVSPVSTERTVAAWTAVAGGVSVAAGAVVLLLGRPTPDATASFVFTPGPRGATGSVAGHF